ncbi:hypothetical protein HY546_03215 [archaeon]|nr:hypothetical protein [archaeon]
MAGLVCTLILGGISAGYLYFKASEMQGAISGLAGVAGALGSGVNLPDLSSPTATIAIMGLSGYLWVAQASFTSLSAGTASLAQMLPDPLFYYIFVIVSSFVGGSLLFRHVGTRILTALLAPLLPSLLITLGIGVVTFVITSLLQRLTASLPVSLPIGMLSALDFLLVFIIAYVFLLLGFEAAAGLRGLISLASKQAQPFKTPAVNVPGTATTKAPVEEFEWQTRGEPPSEAELRETLAPEEPEGEGVEEPGKKQESEAVEEGEEKSGEEREEGAEEGEEEEEEEGDEEEVVVKVKVPRRRSKPKPKAKAKARRK